MRAFMIINMQENYVGENRDKRRFPYDEKVLIKNINQRLEKAKNNNEKVIYITNRFFYQSKKNQPKLVDGLDIISDNIFVKHNKNAFKNKELTEFLRKENITDIELAGIDGNGCIAKTAFAGVKESIKVSVNESCTQALNQKKFDKTRSILEETRINFVG